MANEYEVIQRWNSGHFAYATLDRNGRGQDKVLVSRGTNYLARELKGSLTEEILDSMLKELCPNPENEFRLIVAGCRFFNNYETVRKTLDYLLQNKDHKEVVLVSGCCRGADELGERYAAEKKIALMRFPADFDQYGKSAGPIRNKKMAAFASEYGHGALIAFWDGQSKGTRSMIEEAKKAGLQTRVVRIDSKEESK